MNRVVTLAAAAAFAALAGGVALSEGLGGIAPPAEPAPAPAPPPPAAAPEAPAAMPSGIVKSINLAFIKGVFDRAGVPAKIEKTSDGFNYVSASLGGNFVATAPVDCKNSDPNGECSAAVILSGTMSVKLTPAQINEYSQGLHLATPLLVGEGEPMLRYAFLVNDGIGPDYLEGTLVAFKYEMDSFGEWVGKNKAGPRSAFSAGPAATAKFGAAANFGDAAGSLAKGGKLAP